MRTSQVVISFAVAAFVAGCSGGQADDAAAGESAPSSPSSPSSPSPALPPEPRPENEAPCPYLDSERVAQVNGQRVGSVSTSSDDPPACFFLRPDGETQLTVRVYTGEPDVARGLVDAAAPVATSNPTSQPTGWEGGYESDDDGAVYAVAQDGDAVVITTNQPQSVKARTVATEVISALGF
ncbi:hypothetical protein B1813_14355 [Saccharomonospora piscinae]|uniref:DUF2020 domain-containing protein n=1 Tax=Saccharomonospora piscinae TaxID=687388 RepID=A0A1V9A120_SACPI|nr:DUF2020 domain-containing protein [Saccharomonospora piscinae]OQO90723.1 hypothetical protein B1813_14355 [Saccharomonospora piscinae]